MQKVAQVKIPFTKRAIEALVPPEEGRQYVYDAKQENLAICIAASGSRIFYRTGRYAGRSKRIRLGRFPTMSVEQARKAARAITGDDARGVEPRQSRRGGPTVADLFDHWIAHAKTEKRTWKDDKRQYDQYMGALKSRKLADLTELEVAKWHRSIRDGHGPYQANRCRALLSAMFNKAHEIKFNGPNPVQRVKRFPEQSRERFLRPAEMRPFFEALAEEPPDWRDFWLLALFTGARRGNVAAMAWDDLDLAQGVWYLASSQTKNKRATVVVLPPPAVEILEGRARYRDSKWVFPGKTSTGHVIDPRKSWARVMKRAGIEDLRPHDLRRSLGSWQAIAGASLPIIGASLGHSDVKSTAVYARLQTDPIRASVNGAVQRMLEAAKGTEGHDDGKA
jgi:integrase